MFIQVQKKWIQIASFSPYQMDKIRLVARRFITCSYLFLKNGKFWIPWYKPCNLWRYFFHIQNRIAIYEFMYKLSLRFRDEVFFVFCFIIDYFLDFFLYFFLSQHLNKLSGNSVNSNCWRPLFYAWIDPKTSEPLANGEWARKR